MMPQRKPLPALEFLVKLGKRQIRAYSIHQTIDLDLIEKLDQNSKSIVAHTRVCGHVRADSGAEGYLAPIQSNL